MTNKSYPQKAEADHFTKLLKINKEYREQVADSFLKEGVYVTIKLYGVKPDVLGENTEHADLNGERRKYKILGEKKFTPEESKLVIGHLRKGLLAEGCPTPYYKIATHCLYVYRKDGCILYATPLSLSGQIYIKYPLTQIEEPRLGRMTDLMIKYLPLKKEHWVMLENKMRDKKGLKRIRELHEKLHPTLDGRDSK